MDDGVAEAGGGNSSGGSHHAVPARTIHHNARTSMTNGKPSQPSPIGKPRHAIRAITRAIVSIILLTVLYYNLPLDGIESASAVIRLIVTVLLLVVIMAWQIRSITLSPTPTLRAVEAVAVALPLFILSIASTFFLMSQSNGESFTERLTRTDALYFAVTVLSTVGFGDIAPVTQSARIAVTIQIILDLLLVGVGLRIFVGAVDTGKKRQSPPE
jgi:voltage-gated potassium channel